MAWHDLIDINKIDPDYAEIIYERLNKLNEQVIELQNNLLESNYQHYKQEFPILKAKIEEIVNIKFK